MEFLLCFAASILIDIFDSRKIGIIGAVITAIGFLASAFVDKLQLYFFTYGILVGIGQALYLEAVMSILPHYFNKKLGLANGLMSIGSALVSISTPFGVFESLKKLGLQKTFFIHAGVLFFSVLPVSTFKPYLVKDVEKKWKKRITNSICLNLLKIPKYLVWVGSVFIAFFGYLIPLIFIVSQILFIYNSFSIFLKFIEQLFFD